MIRPLLGMPGRIADPTPACRRLTGARPLAMCALLACVLLSSPGIAKSEEPGVDPSRNPKFSSEPRQLIHDTTQKVLQVIGDAKYAAEGENEQILSRIEIILDEVIDFDSFVRAVMGSYGSRHHFESLASEQERLEFEAMKAKFREIFKARLIDTYGKGMLSFSNEKIVVLPPRPDNSGQHQAIVEQQIIGSSGRPVSIRYRLNQDQTGQWKLRNFQINGVNLGKVYRSQFASAMQRHQGDLDQVIQSWSAKD